MSALPPFDLCREEGWGQLISIDVHGDLTPDEVDILLADVSAHPDDYGLDFDDELGDWTAPHRGFDVERALRYTQESEDGGFTEWIYRPLGDATSFTIPAGHVHVTRLVVDNTWRHRCYRHPDEVAQSGLPAETFAPRGHDQDPLPIIDGYLYTCRQCADALHDHRATQTSLWMAEMKRRREAGVPEALIYA